MNLLEKYKKSIGLSLILTIVTVPIIFIEIKLLNSISAEAVGYLAIIEMFYLLFISILSGNPILTLSKFYSSWTMREKIRNTLAKFLVFNFVYVLLFFMFFLFFEDINLLSNLEINKITFFLFGEVLIIYSFLNGIVNGSLDLKSAVISSKIYPVLRLFFTMLLVFWFSFPLTFNILLLSVVCTLVITNVYLILVILKSNYETKKSEKETSFFDVYFWIFILISMGRSIVLFLYEKVDQLVLLRYIDIEALSIYFALLKIALLIKLIPKIINTSSIPVFSSLLVNKQNKELNNIVNKNLSLNFYLGLIVSSLILFCYPVIFDFINLNTSYLNILILLLLTFQFSITSIIYDSLLNAAGKPGILLTNSILSILIQLALIFYLISDFGLLGVVIAKLFASIFGQYFLFLSVRKSKLIDLKNHNRVLVTVTFILYLASVLYFQNMALILFGTLILILFSLDQLRRSAQ